MKKENEEFRKVAEPFEVFMNALFEANNKRKSEVKSLETIKNITVEMGEECKVNVDILHETLAKLPAEIYLQLYQKMHEKVLGYPPFYCGCNVSKVEERTE